MKIFYLIFIVFSLTYLGVSCTQPASNLGSEPDDDHSEHKHSQTCSDRYSCQDICDDLFSNTNERYACYELSFDGVNTISKVSDEFTHNVINTSELEDLDADDVRAYLEIGFESFVDLVKGEPVGDGAEYRGTPQWNPNNEFTETGKNTIVSNSKKIMEWIAEEGDIAEVILEQDKNFELGLELFQAINGTPISDHQVHDDSDNANDLFICLQSDNSLNYGSTNICGEELLNLSDFNGGVSEFLSGFLNQNLLSQGSFMTFSADERNDAAFEWGHNTLLEFCKEATDQDESDVEVKTCLQMVYCVHRTLDVGVANEGIFRDLEDYDSIVGRTDVRYCKDLADEDRMEDLFD